MEEENSWKEWSRHVLAELHRLNDNIESMDEKIQQINIEIATLKVKSGIWGLLGGVIPVAIFVVIEVLKK